MFVTCLGVFGPYPAANSATSSYLVQSSEGLILLDCGSGSISHIMRFASPLDLNAIVVSHWHYDHMSDLFVLGYMLQKYSKTLDLIAPEPPENIRSILSAFPYNIYDIKTVNEVSGISLSAVKTVHPVQSFAVKIKDRDKTLVYTGDAADESNLFPFCKNADLLLCDAAFLDSERPKDAAHMSARMAALLAAKTDKAKLVLTHFLPGTDLDALLLEASKIYKNSFLAEENKRFEV